MATDFTVIQAVRQEFGDKEWDWDEYPIGMVEANAPFVGVSKDFPFKCPAVDRSQMAVLEFKTFGVSTWNNVLQINGVDIAGGITVGPLWIYIDPHVPLWNTEQQLVDAGVLQEENILHIESTADESGNFDNFIVDNIVIWFKTRTGGVVDPGRPQSTS